MFFAYKKHIIAIFAVLAIVSAFFLPKVEITFDFDDFFPDGDPDLAFFQSFIQEFETDDNFLLIGIERAEGVFDSTFLRQFHDYSIALKDIPYIEEVESLTQMRNPIKTPFGYATVPLIHIDEPSRYAEDKANILSDPRFRLSLINDKATAMVIAAKTKEKINLPESDTLLQALYSLSEEYGFADAHYLGRAYFQKEIINLKMWEMLICGTISVILVTLLFIWIYRRPIGVVIAMTSIGLGLLLFIGLLAALGRELSVMAALYPVLMLIVGTSDVIHFMTKYVDQLRKGVEKIEAMTTTVKEIGMATLLTSVTTSVGFASLLTSNVGPIRDFGVNAALGVMIAYIVVLFFTTSLLLFFDKDQIMQEKDTNYDKLGQKLASSYHYVRSNPRTVSLISLAVTALCLLGIYRITTNYNIENNFPRGSEVVEDFRFFEEEFAGFRPLEVAITVQGDYVADDYEVVQQISKLEDYLQSTGHINAIMSQATLYKSIHKINNNQREDAYKIPPTKREFRKAKKLIQRSKLLDQQILISKDGKKTRLSSRIADIGADSIRILNEQVDQWVSMNLDPDIVSVRSTGTGLIIDKNAIYIRDNLLQGLALALLIVSILMGLLFRNIRMLMIALIPNMVPLLFAAGLIGWLGIDLEAGVSIIFAVVFGIAVDDTIHFLSKYKLAMSAGSTQEEALLACYTETGKAITITTIILFFGFMVLVFSNSLQTNIVGGMISITLVTALIFDMSLLPVLIRKWMPSESDKK